MDLEEKNKVRIAVRELVEFILRKGDINSSFITASSAAEGTRIHQKIQKMNKELYMLQGMEYVTELSLKIDYEYKDFICTVEGRADGIVEYNDKDTEAEFMVDEIKSTGQALELIDYDYNELHWAQAKCYAYIYALQHGKRKMDVQITYCQIEGDQIKPLVKSYTIDELEVFFKELIEDYYVWARFSADWRSKRNVSIKNMNFPFETYRKGQREKSRNCFSDTCRCFDK